MELKFEPLLIIILYFKQIWSYTSPIMYYLKNNKNNLCFFVDDIKLFSCTTVEKQTDTTVKNGKLNLTAYYYKLKKYFNFSICQIRN